MNIANPTLKMGVLASAAAICMSNAALADIRQGDKIGLSVSDIAKSLEINGYEIREIEVKDNRIKAEVTLEGDRLEMKIDPKTGLVTRVEDDD